MSALSSGAHGYRAIADRLSNLGDWLAPLFDLSVRLSVAWVFYKSGLSKIRSWDSTVMLFEYEYSVPLLSPVAAAYLGTAVELIAPALLAIGLMGRFAAAVLFLFNIAAVVSYLSGLNLYGYVDHLSWGLLLLIPVFRGPGNWSVDHLIRKHLGGAPAAPTPL